MHLHLSREVNVFGVAQLLVPLLQSGDLRRRAGEVARTGRPDGAGVVEDGALPGKFLPLDLQGIRIEGGGRGPVPILQGDAGRDRGYRIHGTVAVHGVRVVLAGQQFVLLAGAAVIPALQVGVHQVVHGVDGPAVEALQAHFLAVAAGAFARIDVRLDRFLPQAQPRKNVRRHVLSVRRAGGDSGVSPGRSQGLGGQYRVVVVVDDVVGDARVVGPLGEQRFQEAAGFALVGIVVVPGVGRGVEGQGVENGGFGVVGKVSVQGRHFFLVALGAGLMVHGFEVGVVGTDGIDIAALQLGLGQFFG